MISSSCSVDICLLQTEEAVSSPISSNSAGFEFSVTTLNQNQCFKTSYKGSYTLFSLRCHYSEGLSLIFWNEAWSSDLSWNEAISEVFSSISFQVENVCSEISLAFNIFTLLLALKEFESRKEYKLLTLDSLGFFLTFAPFKNNFGLRIFLARLLRTCLPAKKTKLLIWWEADGL